MAFKFDKKPRQFAGAFFYIDSLLTTNYTWQDFDGADEYLRAFSRPTAVFNALGATDVVTLQQPLIDLSENAYNVTVYYEKYGLSARVRYRCVRVTVQPILAASIQG